VLENTCRCIRDMGGFHKVSLEETLELAHRFSDEYAARRFGKLESQRVTYLFRRNLHELDMVVEELWKELKDAQFAPQGFEVHFESGKEDALPSIPIPNSAMEAMLRGYIDRVDTWKTQQGTTYFRVVDYKTGKKSFDYCDVFNGVGLQMLLYLFALKHSGSDLLEYPAIPAGVLYFPARADYIGADGRLTEEGARKKRQSEWKRKGLLLNDRQVLEAMEPSESAQRIYTMKKNRETGDLEPEGEFADREQLRLLESYVMDTLKSLVEDIASGNVEPNPYTRGTSHNPCAYCPYGPICHPASVPERRDFAKMDARKFWEEVGKKVEKHG
ncbi:MAG TPA: PD-(D/E)XK nuclease family protein, partial [Candidatus Faecousia faecipullorum]|nr:PD-(D/E)XK nuclease family protein [Candidatus Faecousia faecipullorum]